MRRTGRWSSPAGRPGRSRMPPFDRVDEKLLDVGLCHVKVFQRSTTKEDRERVTHQRGEMAVVSLRRRQVEVLGPTWIVRSPQHRLQPCGLAAQRLDGGAARRV